MPCCGDYDKNGVKKERASGEQGEGEQEGEDEDEELEDGRLERVRWELGQCPPLRDGPQSIGTLSTERTPRQLESRGRERERSGDGRGRSRRRG